MLLPDFSDRANVLEARIRRAMFGDGDMLSIDRGTAHGVVLGARYAFYRDPARHDGMPLVHVGDAVVVELGEQTSKVVVVKTIDAISSADVAVPRRLRALADLLLALADFAASKSATFSSRLIIARWNPW